MSKRSMSMWDVFRGFVRKAVEKVTGKLPPDNSVLDAIMKVGEGLELAHQDNYIAPRLRAENEGTYIAQGEAFRMVGKAAEGVKRLLDSHEANVSAPKALKLRTFDNIARIADHYFGEGNPVRKIHSAIERMRVTGERMFQASEPIVRNLVALRAKNRAAYEEMSSLMHDATVANVHPDVPLTDAKNAHLGKNAMRGVWSKAQHPELAKRYNALPEEYKAAFHETTKYFRDEQNKMSLGIINNQVLKLLGHEDAALAQRVHEGNLTDADKTLLGSNVDVLENAGELSKIEGPYVPLMRRGDHVVKGDYKVTSPGNAKVIANEKDRVEFEFGSQKEAEDYAKNSALQATLKKVWVDANTGEKSGANELDSVARYRVTLQNRHVEFVQGKRAAIARAAELAKDGSIAVHEVVPRSLEIDARQGAELSTALSRLIKKLEHSDAYQSASPTEKAALKRSIEEAALASHASTRVSSRALPRRGVAGYSEDLVQNTVDYAGSSSRYLARLEHGTDLEAGMKAMAEQLDRDHSKVGQYARTAISNEVRDRVEGDNGFSQGGKFSPIVKRLLSASFTDKLASPAYSVINAMQPGMVTMPYLSGKYGVGRSFAALGRAYADINAGGIVKAGAKGTATAARGKEAKQDLMSMVMRKLSDDERAMIQHNLDEGTIDGDAGMEVQHLARSYEGVGGKADATLAYMEAVSREMPRAIETINRAVTALATYRLERSKGASHDAAVRASTDAVNSTQFNYSPTNSPTVFNHPLLKIALQFKKYGQGMYQLIGSQIGDAIRNAEPGDRARAIKTLIGIAATHTAMAGALGLPTEPFKYLVMAASPVTGVGWSDVENEIRRQAAAIFGKKAGEVLTRGLPRLLNLDLSRMGLDSVLSFGEPKSNKESDVKTWLFDSVSGPVVSLGADYVKGLNNIANGDFEKAAENLIPLKLASDSLRAYRQASEGKKTAGGKQSSAPYAPTEAALRVLGFGTAREAEEGAERGAYFRQSQKAKDERNGLTAAWVNADPVHKAKAWTAIQNYNRTAPAESKITAKELTDKARRDAKASKTSTLGITPNKRDKRFIEEGVYNTR
jgi:DNA-binding ferritin-like protein (Dps family)